MRGQGAALQRSAAQLREAEARQAYAQTQARRYQQLLAARSTSEEIAAAKQQELQIAEAGLDAAREELARVRAERAALLAQRDNLRLIAPVDGLVTVRNAEPGTTVVAGQAVVELIDPKSLWINARFDQIGAHGLQAGLPAQVVLRSRHGQRLAARVLRVEPLADAVTEETLAKVVFESLPQPLPPIGELAEVTVSLPELAAAPVVPNASIQRVNGTLGVWQVADGALQLAPVKLGAANLEGQVQVLHGIAAGDRVVTYSERALTARSRIDVRGPASEGDAMISLAGRDILHAWGKFVFTGVGLGLLIGVTLTMAGVYRGMVDDAKVLLDNSGADLWVVQKDTLGPYAEPSSLYDDTWRGIRGMPGVARAANVTYLTMQVRQGERDVRDDGRRRRRPAIRARPAGRRIWSPGGRSRAAITRRWPILPAGFKLGEHIQIRRNQLHGGWADPADGLLQRRPDGVHPAQGCSGSAVPQRQ